MAFSPDKIEAIRAGCDIVALIGTYVTLKKSGRNFVGLCPFHGENTPSFSVSAEKKVYHCFGCQVGGDAFDFLMRHDGCDFSSAARTLAGRAGVELEAEAPEVRARRELERALGQVNEDALVYFEQALWRPAGAAARNYLCERRIAPGFAKARRLGFGHLSDAVLQHLRQKHTQEHIQQAGLVSDEGRLLFAGRVIFPIRDIAGRVVGFGGRRLGDARGGPKYINTRDSLLFKKSAQLYGLHEAHTAIRRGRRVCVVEGYTDVLAAHTAGLEDAVAALGTAFTAEHAQCLKRLATEALVVLDGDKAGQRAALEVSMLLMRAELKTTVVPLPAGDDPDSLVRTQGAEALQNAVKAARPAVEYFMEAAFQAPNMSVEDRAAAARQLQPLLACLTSGLERDLYTNRLAEKVGVSLDTLRRHLRPAAAPASRTARAVPGGQARPSQRSPQAAQGPPAHFTESDAYAHGPPAHFNAAPHDADVDAALTQPPAPHPFELELLRELLLFPQLRARFGELAEFALSTPMRDLLDALATSPEPLAQILKAHIHNTFWLQRLCRVAPFEEDPLDDPNVKSNRTFDDILAGLKIRHIDAVLQEVLRELGQVEARGEATDTLLRRKQELTARKRASKTLAYQRGFASKTAIRRARAVRRIHGDEN